MPGRVYGRLGVFVRKDRTIVKRKNRTVRKILMRYRLADGGAGMARLFLTVLAVIFFGAGPGWAQADSELISRLKAQRAEDGHTIAEVLGAGAAIGFHVKGWEIASNIEGDKDVVVSYGLGSQSAPEDELAMGWGVTPKGEFDAGDDDLARAAELGVAAFRIVAAHNVGLTKDNPPDFKDMTFLRSIKAAGLSGGVAEAFRTRGLKVTLVTLEWLPSPAVGLQRGFVLDVFFDGKIEGSAYKDLHARWGRAVEEREFSAANGWAQNLVTGKGPR